jgi:hypothetical protein
MASTIEFQHPIECPREQKKKICSEGLALPMPLLPGSSPCLMLSIQKSA